MQLSRTLEADAPRRKYVSRSKDPGERSPGLKWGQRKLLMNEIEFLTQYAAPGHRVVYAGAAPGTHILFLSAKMFPELDFLLVDPAPFTVKETDRITIINDFFTDELATSLHEDGTPTLFLSDIRTAPPDEAHVIADMAMQLGWYRKLRPLQSMLKFRLPWSPGTTDYPSGTVYTQPYVGGRSTEMRLWIKGPDAPTVAWDNQKYEEQCFHYNTVTRLTRHDHGIRESGLTTDWDCATEVQILTQFLAERRTAAWRGMTAFQRRRQIALLSRGITSSIGGKQAVSWIEREKAELRARTSSWRKARSKRRRVAKKR